MPKTFDICRVCGSKSNYLWNGNLLYNVNVGYFECNHCGYVQTEHPYWLQQAYSNAINDSDTGIMFRNEGNVKTVIVTLLLLGLLPGKVIDYAGGYGILVRLLRDMGIDAFWFDKYCQNILSKGFEYKGGHGDLVTAFEVFEHFVDPVEELDKLLDVAPNVLISTSFIPFPTPRFDEWWYYGKEHGQHIGFFRMKTLEYIAKKKGKYVISYGNTSHLITEIPINKYYWNFLLLFKAYIPFLLKFRLKPKTIDDHLFHSLK